MRDGGALRLRQATALLADALWYTSARGRLVAGDLNTRPDDALHDVLRYDGSPWPGVDVFAAVGDIERGATIRRQTAVGTIEARLDYIYALPGDEGRRARLLDARVVLDRPIDGVQLSDHFGVLADIVL